MEYLASKDPAIICQGLLEIGKERPTPQKIAAVEALLDSKFQGVQSIAAQVLAKWGSYESFARLRTVFERLQATDFHAQRQIIAKAMGSLVRPSDTKPVIEWFLSLPTYSDRYELLPTVAKVDPKRAKPLFESAWALADQQLKHSILVAASEMGEPWMFIPLGQRDADKHIRDLANEFARIYGGQPAGRRRG